MSKLTPDLFQRRYADLVELARARLPSLAPEWTDHNAHDPGITLLELLAWVAEAQLYSLSRLRRDERLAYAALLGIGPTGPLPARGLVWADRGDPRSPAATFARSQVIADDTAIRLLDADAPIFRPAARLLWAPGRIEKLEARHADGSTADLTSANDRGGPPFQPFRDGAGPGDALALTFSCRDEAGLFGPHRDAARGARWSLGFQAAGPPAAPGREPPSAPGPSYSATLLLDDQRVPVTVSDGTTGLLSTGVLLLSLDGVRGSPRTVTLELRPLGRLARVPRLLRIEPNVLPVEQSRKVEREPHRATGAPGWDFVLEVPGLQFAEGASPVTLEVAEPDGLRTWERCDRLSDRGPAECVYELDPEAGRVTFGNGVNGRTPTPGAEVLVSYAVSDGDAGAVARNRRWQVAGFEGAFGVNLDPVVGGAPPRGWIAQRREARLRVREEHALVSEEDLERGALDLPLLEVARAWVAPFTEKAPRTGEVRLVAMRRRPAAEEPAEAPETRRWLEAVRRGLAPRMLMGSRLAVLAPRYVDLAVEAAVEVAPGRAPEPVRAEVEKSLRRRLAPVETAEGDPARAPGLAVTRRDVEAWIRAVEGVRRVVTLRLRDGAGRDAGEVLAVSRNGLPRLGRCAIEAARASAGARP